MKACVLPYVFYRDARVFKGSHRHSWHVPLRMEPGYLDSRLLHFMSGQILEGRRPVGNNYTNTDAWLVWNATVRERSERGAVGILRTCFLNHCIDDETGWMRPHLKKACAKLLGDMAADYESGRSRKLKAVFEVPYYFDGSVLDDAGNFLGTRATVLEFEPHIRNFCPNSRSYNNEWSHSDKWDEWLPENMDAPAAA